MANQKRREDRRIQRTRQMLQQAFVDVVREKSEALRSLWEMEKGFAATASIKITTTESGIVAQAIDSSGSGRPRSSMNPYVST